MKRILFARILVLVSATLFGCGGTEPLPGETSDTGLPAQIQREERTAGSEATRHGISFYRVERRGDEADIEFLNARREVIGGLHIRTPQPGVVQLDDTIDGMIAAFQVNTNASPTALTVSSGGRQETLFQDLGGDVKADASARAFFAQHQALWTLARSVYVELGLDRALLEQVQEKMATEQPVSQMSEVRAMDGGCPNLCKANGCAWFWGQYTHTVPLGDGRCVTTVSGCGC